MAHPLEDPRLDWELLRSYHFDEAFFRDAVERLRAGTLSEATAVISGKIERVNEVVDVHFQGPEVGPIRSSGEAALREGRIAVVVLNGGMATRFGGVVKGVVEVYDGASFLALKAADVRAAALRYGKPVPLVLMNSFATHEATMAHAAAHRSFGLAEGEFYTFEQSISVRLNPDTSLFIGDDGRPSYHAPGHGDFFSSLRGSGVLSALRARGVEEVLFSNVDNLGATVDPVIIGHHLQLGRPMTAEVTEKRKNSAGVWDKGGAPARVDGRLQLVEGFRFPKDFPQEMLPDFSTNNMLFNLAAIDRPLDLERHVVKKTVDGRPALQLESITCEASGLWGSEGPLLPLSLLRVPRDGPNGRFFPVKEPPDLEEMRPILRERLKPR
jgi:UTP--glucose-1-phosphate uridylyltransferase